MRFTGLISSSRIPCCLTLEMLQNTLPLFNVRQEGILLELIKPVNLIEEKDGADTLSLSFLSLLYNLPQLLQPDSRCIKPLEIRLCSLGNYSCESCFPDSGPPIENQGCDPIRFNSPSEEFSQAKNMFLPNIFIESPRTHTVRKRWYKIVLFE